MEILEVAAYLGAGLSALIARNTLRIKNRSFINNMFLFYFTADFIMGTIETYQLFQLKHDR